MEQETSDVFTVLSCAVREVACRRNALLGTKLATNGIVFDDSACLALAALLRWPTDSKEMCLH